MAGIDKLLKHLLQEPPPTNFTWEELVSLLSSFGFQEKTNSGSSRKFVHKETNNKIFLFVICINEKSLTEKLGLNHYFIRI